MIKEGLDLHHIFPEEVLSVPELVEAFYEAVVNPQVAAALLKFDNAEETTLDLSSTSGVNIQLEAKKEEGQPKATLQKCRDFAFRAHPRTTLEQLIDFVKTKETLKGKFKVTKFTKYSLGNTSDFHFTLAWDLSTPQDYISSFSSKEHIEQSIEEAIDHLLVKKEEMQKRGKTRNLLESFSLD